MEVETKPVTILMAEDDPEDAMLVKDALVEAQVANDLRCVSDGEEVMDYLHRRGKYADPRQAPRPGIILMDLNMPKKDGRETLEEIKSDPALRSIPVIVLTTSRAEEDIIRTYGMGANSYIAKPVTFDKLVEIMRFIGRYWFEIAELPPKREGNCYGQA